MHKHRITKSERFIETLLLSGKEGAHPLQLAMALQSNNISVYACKLRSKGVGLKTIPKYAIASKEDAEKVLDMLNVYRTKRGCTNLPTILIAEWA